MAVAAAVAGALGSADAGTAAVRQAIPDEQAGPPFYARIDAHGVIHTEEWAAIPFYRDPSCVPADFNLLDFFDAPRAFSCALTVEGFVLWKNGPPPVDFAPTQSVLRDDGPVPVWLVSWPELEAAVADGVPLRGWFAEPAVDGYEWEAGFAARRGLWDRDRNPRPTVELLSEAIASARASGDVDGDDGPPDLRGAVILDGRSPPRS